VAHAGGRGAAVWRVRERAKERVEREVEGGIKRDGF
jgi:hypothetical protein